MRHLRLWILVLAVAAPLGACAPSILMTDPKTGQVAQCEGPGGVFRRWFDRDTCVQRYQQLGWTRAEG